MRIIIPERIAFKGAGLGNEVAPWAKAFLAAQSIGVRYLRPAWGLNPRKYGQYFGTSSLDWIAQLALKKVAPHYNFSEADYRATNIEDFGDAFRTWAESKDLLNKSHWVVSVGGMWGGKWPIRRARCYLLSELGRTRYTQENIADFASKINPKYPVCTVHLRGDDFEANDSNGGIAQGKFNICLPYEWYESALDAVVEAYGNEVNIVIMTNSQSPKVAAMKKKFLALTTESQTYTDISDLLIMSQADLFIPSVSSFSNLAIFLNPHSTYLWPREHLTPVAGHPERGGIWAFEEQQQKPTSPTVSLAENLDLDSNQYGRAIPFSMGDQLPVEHTERIKDAVNIRQRAKDLVYYGSVHMG